MINRSKRITDLVKTIKPTQDERDTMDEFPPKWSIVRKVVRFWNANNPDMKTNEL